MVERHYRRRLRAGERFECSDDPQGRPRQTDPGPGGPSRSDASSPQSIGCKDLEEADRCKAMGRLLRREGLYSSHHGLAQGAAQGLVRELAAKKRGAKPAERNPLDAKVQAQVSSTSCTAHTITCREKLPGCWD